MINTELKGANLIMSNGDPSVYYKYCSLYNNVQAVAKKKA